MSAQKTRTITELRSLAQSMGAKWSFSDDQTILQQKISQRQKDMLPPPVIPIIPQPEDQRLRTKPPAKVSDEALIKQMLAPYVERGLNLTFTDGQFHMKYGPKTDSGTLRQPPRVIIDCARRVME